jgi:hypothetical protein
VVLRAWRLVRMVLSTSAHPPVEPCPDRRTTHAGQALPAKSPPLLNGWNHFSPRRDLCETGRGTTGYWRSGGECQSDRLTGRRPDSVQPRATPWEPGHQHHPSLKGWDTLSQAFSLRCDLLAHPGRCLNTVRPSACEVVGIRPVCFPFLKVISSTCEQRICPALLARRASEGRTTVSKW